MTQKLHDSGYEILEKEGNIFVANDSNPSNYMDKMSTADCIVVRIGQMTKEDIENSPNLKVIGRPGVGYDSIDVATATKNGIPIVITPSANADSVAEHTLAMMFALSSNLVESHNEASKGNFAVRGNGKTFELKNKTVGIIGIGDIGKRVATLCQGIKMKVIAYDTAYTKEGLEKLKVGYCSSLTELLLTSDVVTIHTPLTVDTKAMISEAELKIMKKTAVLINCARGGIVDEIALITALNQDEIAGAGLDVLVEEPFSKDDPIFTAKNIIITPHSAAQKKEAVINMATMCANGCVAIMNGKKWSNIANPDVYDHPRWKDK